MEKISYYVILIFVIMVYGYSFIKKKKPYDSFVKGSCEALKSGIMILPYLLSMYVAVNVFKSSGILTDLIKFNKIPSELFVQGIFRPISSHASLSMMLSIYNQYGVDSLEGLISTVLQGGSDTTVYVMGLYFGSVGVKKTKHAYTIGLLCDLICFICCILLFFIKLRT